MKKIIFGALLAGLCLSLPAHAQEPAKAYKNLTLRLEGDSGTVVPRWNMRTFEGNEGIFGVRYAQNFSTATWMQIYLDAELKTTMVWAYNGTAPTTLFRYALADTTFEAGFGFTEYFLLAINSKGLLKLTPSYTAKLPANQRIRLYTGVEVFFTGTRGLAVLSGLSGTPVPAKGNILDLFQIGLSYSITAADFFTFTTDFSFRASGDNTEDFQRYSYFRWDNMFAFKFKQGTGIFFRLRYQPKFFAGPNTGGDFFNQLNLMAGINHTFDFSKVAK